MAERLGKVVMVAGFVLLAWIGFAVMRLTMMRICRIEQRLGITAPMSFGGFTATCGFANKPASW